MKLNSREYVAERLRLCQQIARLVRAKLPISGQLQKFESGRGTESKLAAEVSQKLEDGQSLASALAGDNSYQSRVLSGCIRAGEAAHQLDEVLDQWANLQLADLRNRRTFVASMIYPVLLVVIALTAMYIVVNQLVPMYAEMYMQLEREIPAWLSPVLWCHDHPWICGGVLLAGISAPFLIVHWRRRGFDATGLPKHPVRRKRIFALTSDVAHRLLSNNLPIKDTVQLSCQAAGLNASDVSTEASQLETDRPTIGAMAPEASLILNELHSNVITNREAIENLQLTARIYEESAEQTASATIRRLPMLVAVSVGFTIVSAYAGLIYAPWVQLLTEIVDVPNVANM